VKYLGYQVEPDKVRVLPVKLNRQVQTLHDVQKLVGALQWVRSVVGIGPKLMQPFYDLLKGDSPWEK
ncbi:PO113 protein, partial [Ciconia maguari]|nr:PO113 protein [Ciconia maguari]